MLKYHFCLLFLLSASCHAAPPKGEIEKWQEQYKAGLVVGLDVRTSMELKLNPAPGAQHQSIMDLQPFIKKTKKDQPIFVFCESGGRSANAKKRLQKAGFSKVTNVVDWRTWNKITGKN